MEAFTNMVSNLRVDHMIPPDVQRTFAKQMNATTISLPLAMRRMYHIQMKLRISSSKQQKESNGEVCQSMIIV